MKLILSLLLPLFTFAAPEARFIEIQGSINPGSAAYFLDAIQEAEQAGAKLLVVRLDTPGGLLSSTRDIIQGISKSKVPVAVYVSPGGASATSAGALIGISAHVIAMAPGTNLGAAHPVDSGGGDVKGDMKEKITNDTAALARAQATLRGRNPATAELIVTKSKSFSPEEAVKAGAADLVAADLKELLEKIDGKKIQLGEPAATAFVETKNLELKRIEMKLQQRVLHFLADPNISAMLMALGGLAIYAEISAGFTLAVPGLLGVLCLVLGFVSLQTLPVNVGGAVLFGLGFVLLIAETYITSYGLLTIAALASLLIGGLFLIDPTGSDMRVSLSLLLPMVGAVGLIAGFVAYVITKDAFKFRAKQGDFVVGEQARIETVEAGGLTGTAYVSGELWKFKSESAVKAGDLCRVLRTESLVVILERRN